MIGHLLKRIGVVVMTLLVLQQVVLRILRRAVPRPMPSRLAPILSAPWRSWLFGTPEEVLDLAGVMPGMQVLEIGPGPGVYTVPLAQRVVQNREGSVTCVEIQPEMIAMLRQRLKSAGVRNVEVVEGDGRQMPLPDSSFDLVFLASVIGETPDLPALFRECARVLKPEGILTTTEYIVDPDFRFPGTVRRLATEAGMMEAGQAGLPWWGFTARYRKPSGGR